MADTKITALTALTAADPANDVIPIVDVSDTTMAASGTTKKISVNNILGASGTATLASATITGAATVGTTLGVTGVSTLDSAIITGDLTVDTSTLKVDSTNNVVGIGTTTPTSYAFNDPAKLVIANTGTAGAGNTFTIASGSTGFGQIAFANGTSGTDRYNGYIKYSHSTNAMEFYTNAGTLGMTLNSSQNLAFPSGKGIDFSATADGSGTVGSEVLSDYEEGTFTPNIGGTATYTTQTGTYTKIGNRVYVSVRLVILLAGTGEDFRISGLPFASGSGQWAASVGYFANLKTNAAFLSAYVNGSQIAMTGTTVSTANITNNMGVIGNATDIMLSGFYIV